MTVPVAPDGLPQERTILAWRRSALAFVGVGLLVLRGSVVHGSAVSVTVAVLGLVLATSVFGSTVRRGRWMMRSRSAPHIRVLRDGRLPALVTVIALLPGVAELLLAVRP